MNYYQIKKSPLQVILLLFLVSILPKVVDAEVVRTQFKNVEVSNDFAVGPGKAEVFVEPGETVTRNISVTNRIDEKVNFVLDIEDFVGSHDDPSQAVVLMGDDSDSPYSLKDFIQPEISEFTLDFGENIKIPITISIPEDAEPRGYYGAVLVANEPQEMVDPETGEEVSGQTKLVSRVGSLFLVKVAGETVESGYVSDFDIAEPKKNIYNKNPENFEIIFRNEGNVHLVPYGEITITNIVGQTIDILPVDGYFVLPESTRARRIKWGNSNFTLGRYEASLSLYKGYGNEDNLEKESVVFWVIPWKIVLSVFVGLFVIITLCYYILSKFEIKRKK